MQTLRTAYAAIILGLAGVAGVVLAMMCTLIIFDVTLRNLGLQPPRATVAITEYALLYFTMFAAPYLVRTRGHVVVRVIYDRLQPGTKRFMETGVYVLCAAVSFCITYISGSLVVESLMIGDVEPRSIDVPRWILFTPLLIGFFFVGCEFVRFLFSKDSFYAAPDQAAHTEERY